MMSAIAYIFTEKTDISLKTYKLKKRFRLNNRLKDQ